MAENMGMESRTLEGFGREASDLVKAIGFACGPEIQRELMMACWKRCPTRVTVTAVENEMEKIWQSWLASQP